MCIFSVNKLTEKIKSLLEYLEGNRCVFDGNNDPTVIQIQDVMFFFKNLEEKKIRIIINRYICDRNKNNGYKNGKQ